MVHLQHGSCRLDIALLRRLVARVEEQRRLADDGEVDAVARAGIPAELGDAASYRPGIAHVPCSYARQASADRNPRERISQTPVPVLERAAPAW